MSCAETEPLLPAWRDGELGAAEQEAVAAHLQSCAACTATVRALEEMDVLFRGIPRDAPPQGMAARVATNALRRVVREGPVRVALPRGVLAAAASLALVSTGVIALASTPGSSPLVRVRGLGGRFATSVIRAEEKAQQMTEEVRVLRLILTTALTGRLEDVGARVEEWRRLQERQQPAADRKTSQASNEMRLDFVKRCNLPCGGGTWGDAPGSLSE